MNETKLERCLDVRVIRVITGIGAILTIISFMFLWCNINGIGYTGLQFAEGDAIVEFGDSFQRYLPMGAFLVGLASLIIPMTSVARPSLRIPYWITLLFGFMILIMVTTFSMWTPYDGFTMIDHKDIGSLLAMLGGTLCVISGILNFIKGDD